MSLNGYYTNDQGQLVGCPVKGMVRRVSENPLDYAILDAEAACIYGLDQQEVQGLLTILQCTSEAQHLVKPKEYSEF